MAVSSNGSHPWTTPRHNLPAVSPPFFGRESEERELLGYLRTWETKFGISGPGGIGKSALALKIGRRFVDEYEALPTKERFAAVIRASAKRVVLTPHATRRPREVVSTMRDLYRIVMRTLGLPVRRATKATAVNYDLAIREAFDQQLQPVLLILDDFEEVQDAELCRFAQDFGEPHKLLVTSRTTEWLGQRVSLTELRDDSLSDYITSEWQRRGVNFDVKTVRNVVRKTHGLPLAAWLAIELGALHQPRTLGQQLATARPRLNDYVLGEAINRLKTQDPRAYYLLLALAFFDQQQGATTEQLAAVLERENADSCRRRLEMLRERSLVYPSDAVSSDPRYKMLPYTRHFALAEARRTPQMRDWEAKARQRWREWFTQLAHQWGGPDRSYWVGQFFPIAQDWLNFRAVFDWCMKHGEFTGLQDLWTREGVEPYTNLDGASWPCRLRVLKWLAREADRRGVGRVAVAMRSCAGWTYAQKGDLVKADTQYRLAWRRRKDATLEVQCELASNLAELHLRQMTSTASGANAKERARKKAGAQLRLHSKLLRRLWRSGTLSEDRMARQVINGLYYRGRMYLHEGKMQRAKACFARVRAIAVVDTVAFERASAYADTWLGYILMGERRYTDAMFNLAEARRVLHPNHDERGEARVLALSALLELRKAQDGLDGDLKLAFDRASDASALYTSRGMKQERDDVERLIELVQKLRT